MRRLWLVIAAGLILTLIWLWPKPESGTILDPELNSAELLSFGTDIERWQFNEQGEVINHLLAKEMRHYRQPEHQILTNFVWSELLPEHRQLQGDHLRYTEPELLVTGNAILEQWQPYFLEVKSDQLLWNQSNSQVSSELFTWIQFTEHQFQSIGLLFDMDQQHITLPQHLDSLYVFSSD